MPLVPCTQWLVIWRDGWILHFFTITIWRCIIDFALKIFFVNDFNNIPYIILYLQLLLTSQNIFLLLFSLIHLFTIDYLTIKKLLRDYWSNWEAFNPFSFLWITIQYKNWLTKIYTRLFYQREHAQISLFWKPIGVSDGLPGFQFSLS